MSTTVTFTPLDDRAARFSTSSRPARRRPFAGTTGRAREATDARRRHNVSPCPPNLDAGHRGQAGRERAAKVQLEVPESVRRIVNSAPAETKGVKQTISEGGRHVSVSLGGSARRRGAEKDALTSYLYTEKGTPANVLLVGDEDDLHEAWTPRIAEMGGDEERVYGLEYATGRPFDLVRDIAMLGPQ